MKGSQIICMVVGIALAVLASFLFGRLTSEPQRIIEERVDTLVIRDTMTAYEPIYVTRRVVDSVPYPVVDTMRIHDTLVVFLERSQICWEDSLGVVYASGVDPQIDSVIHYTSKMVITDTKVVEKVKRTRWGIGLQVGGGIAVADGKLCPAPYVGVGFSYNLLSW